MKKTVKIIAGVLLLLLVSAGAYWKFLYKRPFVFIPLEYTSVNTPTVKITVQGKSYPVLVDLGSDALLELDAEILDDLEKEDLGSDVFSDFFNNEYVVPTYLIKKLRLGEIRCKNWSVNARSIEFKKNAMFDVWLPAHLSGQEGAQTRGAIGRPFVLNFPICLDFINDRVCAYRDFDNLKSAGIDVDTYVKVHCNWHRLGLIVEIGTDFGVKRFLIDTGSSVNCFKVAHDISKAKSGAIGYFTTSKFVLGDYDFGKQVIYPMEFGSVLDGIDGVLGMHFLKDRVICLSHPCDVIHISK